MIWHGRSGTSSTASGVKRGFFRKRAICWKVNGLSFEVPTRSHSCISVLGLFGPCLYLQPFSKVIVAFSVVTSILDGVEKLP